jgi:hypothetical protein
LRDLGCGCGPFARLEAVDELGVLRGCANRPLRFGDLERLHRLGALALVEVGGAQVEVREIHFEAQPVQLDPFTLVAVLADRVAHLPHDLVPSLAVVGVDALLEVVLVIRSGGTGGEQQQ